MFALGFGGEADMGLLRRFALATNGIEKHIYKDIDAADQLVTFFQSIKAPVLKDLYFKYSSKQVRKNNLSQTIKNYPEPIIRNDWISGDHGHADGAIVPDDSSREGSDHCRQARSDLSGTVESVR